jgi:hypothetical protein
MSIDQLERRFRQLKAQLQSGTIGQEQFELEVQRLQYRDPRGLYWTIGAQTGQWYVYDGATWVPRQPLGRQPGNGSAPSDALPGVQRKPARRQRGQPVLMVFSCLGLLFIVGIAIAGVAIVGTIAAQVARPTTTATPFLLSQAPTLTATVAVSNTEQAATAAVTSTAKAMATEEVTAPTKPAAPTKEPPPATDTPTPQAPQPALQGTIAYSVFGWDPRLKIDTYQIFLLKADGSDSVHYVSNASQVFLSADGNLIAYKQWNADSAGLAAGGVSGGGFFRLTDKFEDALPSFSPDGHSVLMFSRRDGQRKSIIYPLTAGGFSQDGDIHGINDGEYPFWMSDGRIVFKGWGVTAGGLRIMNPDGGGVIPLTQDGSDTAPAASRDAKTIAFMSARDGNWEIYKINVDGSGLARLTEDHAADGLPTWSPDGLSIAFASNRGGQWAIWVMNADGSNQRKLHDMEGTPDGLVPGQPDYVSKGWLEERISWGGK